MNTSNREVLIKVIAIKNGFVVCGLVPGPYSPLETDTVYAENLDEVTKLFPEIIRESFELESQSFFDATSEEVPDPFNY